MEKHDKEKGDWLSDAVKVTDINPDELNDEGKRNLAHDIVEEISIREINKFIRKYGYKKDIK